jgi:hypothetical protein
MPEELINNDDIESVMFRFPCEIGEQLIEFAFDGSKMTPSTAPAHIRELMHDVYALGIETYFDYQQKGIIKNRLSIFNDRFSFFYNGRYYFGIAQGKTFLFMCENWQMEVGPRQ